MASKKKAPPAEAMDLIRELGRQGGKKRAANLSRERRAEIAKNAAAARWGAAKSASKK